MRLDSEYFSKYQKFVPAYMQTGLIGVFYLVRSWFYRGDRVYCECCESTYSQFLLPYHECPGCGSQSRQRLMLLYLRNRTDFFTRAHKLLHLAPEASLEPIFRSATNLQYLSADLMLPRAMVKMDMTDIPYPAESFSLILCSHVLEHIPDDIRAMRELHRVLSEDGWAILQVPVDKNRASTYEDFSITAPAQRAKHFGRFDHCRIYGRDYRQRLERAGFAVTVDAYVTTFSSADIERHGLEDWEDIYLCKKNPEAGSQSATG